ncbi:acyl carrier protein [Roseovarius sp. A21]|uniref:Acyl carrier protein AcpXL n=1 Tax=Roseovarius bejariae TaxID=2576383 RepID=A0A844D0S9_9RHOB|nr:acyl carrier protein [Roseovarius bejariae]MRU14768.1 acyl carrier protein [Roseovarius bejariae]
MTRDEIRSVFIDELTRIAPDVEAATLSDDDHLMDDLGLDSMDILNLVTALQTRLGLSVPETDYPRLETPEKAVDYLSRKLG